MFEMMVLAKLMCRPCHGYELKTYLANFNPNNNKIYPMLRQFNEKGYVAVQIQAQPKRPSRKIYSITSAGRERFAALLRDFDLEKAQNADEFNLRISFSFLLGREAMHQVLQYRREALLHQASVPDLIPTDQNTEDIGYLRAHHARLRTLELEFLDEMEARYRE